MGQAYVQAERVLAAPAERVYAVIADYRQHHPRILPPAIFDLQVEQGGVGAGTIMTFKVKLAGRTQRARQRVAEPRPGRVLTETDINGNRGLVTTFTVEPLGDGCRLRIETAWQTRGLMG